MMKMFVAGALVIAQLLAVVPSAGAATLEPDRALSTNVQDAGAFAGARMRLQLGGTTRASAGLALAPMGRSVGHDGNVRMRFGDGLALGIGSRQPPALTLAGTRVDQLRFGQSGKAVPTGKRMGMSTAGYVAIGVGVVLIGAFLVYGAVGDAATE
jgi:hypothetical protein